MLPPGEGEKEEKKRVGLSTALKLIAKLYDATTEANDIVNVLYKALPKKYRSKNDHSMSDKAYRIWQNLDHIDISKAIGGVLYNHYEDKIYGQVFSAVGKHSPYGVMLGNRPKPPGWVFRQ